MKEKKMDIKKTIVPRVPKPIGPSALVEDKKEIHDDPKLRAKHIQDDPLPTSKPEKKKHSGGSSRSSSKGASGEKKMSKRTSQSLKKAPSGQGK